MKKFKTSILSAIAAISLLPGCVKESRTLHDPGTIDSGFVKDISITKEFKGYITRFVQNNGRMAAVVDTLEWITDKNAENGFTLRNPSKDSIKIEMTSETQVTMQTFSRDTSGGYKLNQKISVEQFYSFISKNSDKLMSIPFNFLIVNNKVQEIKEIYIP